LWTKRGPPTAHSKARLIVESGAGCRSSVADQVAYRLRPSWGPKTQNA
jgi:hypothetical protein